MDRPFPSHEPPANLREFARNMRHMYVAMVQEGFSTDEAMHVITSIIQASSTPGAPDQ